MCIRDREETDHFDHFYRQPIGDLALMEALRYGIGRDQSKDGKFWIGGFHDWETYHYALFTPLIDAFWDVWEEAVGLHPCWEKAVEHYKLDTHNLFTGSYWPGMKQSE